MPAPWLCTVDLGVHLCGVALWNRDQLYAVTEAHRDTAGGARVKGAALAVLLWLLRTVPPGTTVRLVFEAPVDYPGMAAREANLAELRDVADHIARIGRKIGLVRTVRSLRPYQWKRNVPKRIHQNRILAALSRTEAPLVSSLPRTRDALDAVGIGLVVLRRVKPGR